MPYRKILCPVDFSGPSRAAMMTAVEQARSSSGRLTLVHVYQLPMFAAPPGGMVPLYLAEIATAAEQEIGAWKVEAEQAGAPAVEGVAVQGVPWDKIVGMASDGAYDLIVMGTHGRTGLKHVLLGSVAEKVARHAQCAVLIVR